MIKELNGSFVIMAKKKKSKKNTVPPLEDAKD